MNHRQAPPLTPPAADKANRSNRSKWLRRTLYLLLGLGALALLLGAALLLFLDPIVKKVLETRIRNQTGLQATIGQLSIGLVNPHFSLRDFKIINPTNYGASALVDLPEFSFELDPGQFRKRILRFKLIRFNLREVNVVKDSQGVLNLQILAGDLQKTWSLSATSSITPPGFQFAGVDRMFVTVGRLKYSDLGEPAKNEDLALEVENELVQNLRTEAELMQWYGAFCVRLFLQMVTQQMSNRPEHSQSFGKIVKQIARSIPLWSGSADDVLPLPPPANTAPARQLKSSP